MSDPTRLVLAFVVGLLITAVATPLARTVAIRVGLLDVPVGYKGHLIPTPYLGGAAVLSGFAIAATTFAGTLPGFGWFLACALALLAIGTVDDRVQLGISLRLAVEVAAATALWSVGWGWSFLPADALNLVLTIAWVVGVTNAFNLMDNLDGAAATVAGVSAAGAGSLAVVEGDVLLGALAFALAGACAGFLPQNLAKPSRIFLGDGGSMPIGLAVAAAIMVIPPNGLGWTSMLACAPLVALPIFDTALVVVSRYRRGAPILQGGRDHLTHRLLAYVGSERYVALVLAVVQGLMCGLAVALHESTAPTAVAGAMLTALAGVVALAVLETEPGRVARAERPG
jgi:UDP-GlcNAc:undecaprenyl-phosphate/decaprenyl-phosphate GlcNAc-1-phosphate transferase